MIAFIDDHREAYGVEPICKVLPIAPSTYRAHAAKRADPAKLSARAKQDAIRRSRSGVSSRRTSTSTRAQGLAAIAPGGRGYRPMHRRATDAEHGPARRDPRQACQKHDRRHGRTVSAGSGQPPVQGSRPDALWVSDFTYVATWTGFVYVAFVIDAYARRIVGWRASADRTCKLRSRCVGTGPA